MAKKSGSNKRGKFKAEADEIVSRGKSALSKGKNAVTPIGKRGKTPIGKRSKKK